MFNAVMPMLLLFLLQDDSFHTFWSAYESMKKRLKHCIKGKIPKVDAVRDILTLVDPEGLRHIYESVIDIVFRNRVLRGDSSCRM